MTKTCSMCRKPNAGENPFLCHSYLEVWYGPVEARIQERLAEVRSKRK